MRIVLDRPRCEGHGLCEEAAPEVYDLDDDGDLVLGPGGRAAGAGAQGRAGARVCPVAALRSWACRDHARTSSSSATASRR